MTAISPKSEGAVSRPTEERMAKLEDLDWTIGGKDQRAGRAVITVYVSPLDRLFRRNQITWQQFNAGEKFYNHWYRAGMAGKLKSPSLGFEIKGEGGFSALPVSEGAVFHLQQWRGAVAAIGKAASIIVTAIACEGKNPEEIGYALKWKNRPQAFAVGLDRLRWSLDKLCAHWG